MPELPYLGLDEVKDFKSFGKALFAEFLGTALLVRKSNNTILKRKYLKLEINCSNVHVETYLYPLQLCDTATIPTLEQIVHLIALQRCLLVAEVAWVATTPIATQNWVRAPSHCIVLINFMMI